MKDYLPAEQNFVDFGNSITLLVSKAWYFQID